MTLQVERDQYVATDGLVAAEDGVQNSLCVECEGCEMRLRAVETHKSASHAASDRHGNLEQAFTTPEICSLPADMAQSMFFVDDLASTHRSMSGARTASSSSSVLSIVHNGRIALRSVFIGAHTPLSFTVPLQLLSCLHPAQLSGAELLLSFASSRCDTSASRI